AETLAQFFSRSNAIFRNAGGYLLTRFFATRSSFPCIVLQSRVSHFWGSVHTDSHFGSPVWPSAGESQAAPPENLKALNVAMFVRDELSLTEGQFQPLESRSN